MTDLTNGPKKAGFGKTGSAFIATFIATQAATFIDKHYGGFYTQLGVTPDIMKDFFECTLVSLSVWLTPTHFVQWVTDCILFVKSSVKEWKSAWDGIPPKDPAADVVVPQPADVAKVIAPTETEKKE